MNPRVLELAEDANALVPLLPGEARVERPGFVLWLGRDPSWNAVQRVRLGDVRAAVEEVRGLLRGRGRAQWEFAPSATPHDLEARLVALGFEPDVEPLQTIKSTGASSAPRTRRTPTSPCS